MCVGVFIGVVSVGVPIEVVKVFFFFSLWSVCFGSQSIVCMAWHGMHILIQKIRFSLFFFFFELVVFGVLVVPFHKIRYVSWTLGNKNLKICTYIYP